MTSAGRRWGRRGRDCWTHSNAVSETYIHTYIITSTSDVPLAAGSTRDWKHTGQAGVLVRWGKHDRLLLITRLQSASSNCSRALSAFCDYWDCLILCRGKTLFIWIHLRDHLFLLRYGPDIVMSHIRRAFCSGFDLDGYSTKLVPEICGASILGGFLRRPMAPSLLSELTATSQQGKGSRGSYSN